MKIALVVQPNRIASGGGQILRMIAEVLAEENDVDIILLRPATAFTFRSAKDWIKVALTKVDSLGDFKVTSFSRLEGYHRIYAGWVGDVAQLLRWGVNPARIVHICQSIETWGGNAADSALAYGTSLERWFVARWLENYLVHCTTKSAYIGNAIGEGFVSAPARALPSRSFISMLTHPGWWKNVTETAIVADSLSKASGMQIQTFGTHEVGFEHKFVHRPAAVEVRACLDRTTVFLSLSHYEGMPLVVMEALARGCFVVLSDIPAHREIHEMVGDKHCAVIQAAPLKFCELIRVRSVLADLVLTRPAFVEDFLPEAFKQRVRAATQQQLRNNSEFCP